MKKEDVNLIEKEAKKQGYNVLGTKEFGNETFIYLKKEMEEMKVIVKWEGDSYWMNPDNLLLALRSYCPNTKFECEYLIHPSKDKTTKKRCK